MSRSPAWPCWLAAAFALGNLISMVDSAEAITISWVTVGQPANAADANLFGTVADSYRIMAFEFTNAQYAAFLNAVDPEGLNPNSIYNSQMGTDVRGGITNDGPKGLIYDVKPNMGDKPVNYVSWFDAARVANWLHNGQGQGGTETGAYTLANMISGEAPAVNSGARFSLPTENQWYKAAYFRPAWNDGLGGYSAYATDVPQPNQDPAPVTATPEGVGQAGDVSPVKEGNYANFQMAAVWNGRFGNVTSVGTNGGPNAYGAFDMSGNVWEWSEPEAQPGISRTSLVVRGGGWGNVLPTDLSSSTRFTADVSSEDDEWGFRLVSPVPEPGSLALAAAAAVAAGAWRRLAFTTRTIGRAAR